MYGNLSKKSILFASFFCLNIDIFMNSLAWHYLLFLLCNMFPLFHVREYINKVRLISCIFFSPPPTVRLQLSNIPTVLLELLKGIGSDDILVYPAFQLHFAVVHRLEVLFCKSNQYRPSRINSSKTTGKVSTLHSFSF